MKKAIVLVAVLGLVAMANADVRIFFTKGGTGTGITNPAMAFLPTGGLGNDGQITDPDSGDVSPGAYYLTGAPPAYTTDIPTVDATLGEFVYVWLQFYTVGTVPQFDEHGNPIGGASTYLPNNGVLFSASMESTNANQQFAWYKYDNSNPDELGGNSYRWDNSADQLTGSTVAFTAVQGTGIKNATAASLNFGQQSRTALLGAIKPSTDALGLQSMTALLDNYGLPAFAFKISTVNGGAGYSVLPTFGQYNVIPEPASMLLLGLAGLLIRRR